MGAADRRRQRRVGEQGGRAGRHRELRVVRGARRGGLGPYDAGGGGQQAVERGVGERPRGEGEFGGVRGDVAALAGPHRTHGEHGLFGGGTRVGRHRLEAEHGGGGHQDRVDGEVRGGRVAAPAVEGDVGRDAARHEGSPGRRVGDGAGGERGGVLGEDRVRGAEPLVQAAVLQHRPGPAQRLLGGLAHHEERAAPAVPVPGEEGHRPGHRRDVQVVAAGVHGPGDGARVRQAGGLGDGERVELGAQEHGGAGAVAQDADEAVAAADRPGDREAVVGQAGGEEVRGAVLVAGEFGVGVQVQVEGEGGPEQRARQGRGPPCLFCLFARRPFARRPFARRPFVPVAVGDLRRSRRCDHFAPHPMSLATSLIRTAVRDPAVPLSSGASEVTAKARPI